MRKKSHKPYKNGIIHNSHKAIPALYALPKAACSVIYPIDSDALRRAK